MNKKVKAMLSAALAAVLSVSSAFAANITAPSAKVTDDKKGITVTAGVDSAVDNVVVKIMEVGHTETTASAVIKATNVIDMYKENNFEETFKFTDELASGRYLIYLSGSGITAETLEVWYQRQTDRDTLVQSIFDAATAADTETALFADSDSQNYGDGSSYDTADMLSLKNALYKDAYDTDVSKMLFGAKTQDYATLQRNFLAAEAAAAFNANDFSAWVNTSDYTLKTKIWADGDAEMGLVQKHYNETLSNEGRKNVIALVSGKNFETLEQFNAAFAKAVIYNGAYKAKADLTGYGHYYQMISDCAAASEELLPAGTRYFGTYLALDPTQRSTVESAVLRAKATTFDTMISAMNNAISNLNRGGTENTTNTGSTSSPGLSISGNSTPTIPSNPNTFSDLSSVEWARTAIETLKTKGIVSGVGDGTYEPNRTVNREEFVKMLISALGTEVGEGKACFTDVSADAWYAPYVTAAFENGFTRGREDGSFGIGSPITREECCAFIYRAAKDRLSEGTEKTFNDIGDVSEYALESVKALSSAGIIVGDENGSFNPRDNVTRAQAAVMIYKLVTGGNN